MSINEVACLKRILKLEGWTGVTNTLPKKCENFCRLFKALFSKKRTCLNKISPCVQGHRQRPPPSPEEGRRRRRPLDQFENAYFEVNETAVTWGIKLSRFRRVLRGLLFKGTSGKRSGESISRKDTNTHISFFFFLSRMFVVFRVVH